MWSCALVLSWALRRAVRSEHNTNPYSKRFFSTDLQHVVTKEGLQLSASACLVDNRYIWEAAHSSPLPTSAPHSNR